MRQIVCFSIATSRTGHDNILKWNFSEDTALELCYALELIQPLYAQKDKENGVDFYNSVFPEEASRRSATSAALKQKKTIITPEICYQL